MYNEIKKQYNTVLNREPYTTNDILRYWVIKF